MKKFDELMSVGNEIENITAEDAKQKLNDSNVQFIDVRDKDISSEWIAGRDELNPRFHHLFFHGTPFQFHLFPLSRLLEGFLMNGVVSTAFSDFIWLYGVSQTRHLGKQPKRGDSNIDLEHVIGDRISFHNID